MTRLTALKAAIIGLATGVMLYGETARPGTHHFEPLVRIVSPTPIARPNRYGEIDVRPLFFLDR